MVAPVSRRERLREATLTEIKAIARRQLVTEGPTAVSLRAIAREMGMTPPALYRYYASHEDLLGALIADLYDELSAALVAARDSLPREDIGGRLTTTSRAFRRWALERPREFALLFGSPLPGYLTDPESPADQASARFGQVFFALFLDLWARRPFPIRPEAEIDPAVIEQLRTWLPEEATLPIGAVEVFIRCWARLYGLVCMEAFGHLHWAVSDAEALFELELRDLATMLGLGNDYRPPQRSQMIT